MDIPKIVPFGWVDDEAKQAERREIASLDVVPGKYIYHAYRYGERNSFSFDTLEEALIDAYWGFDGGHEWGLLIALDGQIVVDKPDLIGLACALADEIYKE